jgi:hypothetical protein
VALLGRTGLIKKTSGFAGESDHAASARHVLPWHASEVPRGSAFVPVFGLTSTRSLLIRTLTAARNALRLTLSSEARVGLFGSTVLGSYRKLHLQRLFVEGKGNLERAPD